MSYYVYIKSESNLYTVGYYDPYRNWISESDHEKQEDAVERVRLLNGGAAEDALTKRLYRDKRCEFAKSILAGLCTGYRFPPDTNNEWTRNVLITEAIALTDALIARLNADATPENEAIADRPRG